MSMTEYESDDLAARWVWPSNEEINDFPDPLGFDREWREWTATMSGGPSINAEIFAREYLQNSWDSIQAQVTSLEAGGVAVPDHGVDFRFVRLQGDAAQRFVDSFGLDGHRHRFAGMSQRHRDDNRLGESTLITAEPAHVDLLIASETCGQGMYGPWYTGGKAGVVSRLKSALMHTKSEKNSQGAGGSWGHGKKAVANASKCRTIAVYTHFGPRDEYPDDDIGTRLLGVSYWRSHDLDDRAHVGLGLLGVEVDEIGSFVERFRPLEDEEADEYVERLAVPGLAVRHNGDPASLGTSYLIVEPSFSPADLASALERNWWPLLGQDRTRIAVHDYDGEELTLAPQDRDELRPFLQAQDLATGTVEPRERGDSVAPLMVSGIEVGVLALTSDDSENGWSYADPDHNRTLVALVRNDMVIAYEPFPRKQRQKGPYLRGTLLVDRTENSPASELLRMSEPHLHNEWQTEAGNAVPKESADFAAATLSSVQKRVGALRSSLKEQEVQVARRFAVFSRVFSEGKAPSVTPSPKPRQPPRPFRITGASNKHLDANLTDPTLIRAQSTVNLSLTEKQLRNTERLEVTVTLGWRVMEERGSVPDTALLDDSSVVVPSGFVPVDGSPRMFRGWLTADPQAFTWSTNFFPDDWQIAPDPVVEAIEDRDGGSGVSTENPVIPNFDGLEGFEELASRLRLNIRVALAADPEQLEPGSTIRLPSFDFRKIGVELVHDWGDGEVAGAASQANLTDCADRRRRGRRGWLPQGTGDRRRTGSGIGLSDQLEVRPVQR